MRLNNSSVGASGLVYDGVDLSQTFQIVDMSIPLLPGIRAVTHDLAQRPGSYFASRKVGTREIKVRLRLDAETRDPMGIFRAWRSVSGLLNKDEPKQLKLDEDKYCYALLVGETEIEDAAYYGEAELAFLCFDPYFYGSEHSYSFSSGQTRALSVLGSVPAYPTFELTATTTTVRVTNASTGEYVSVPSTRSGSSVVIDMERQYATIGGAYAPVALLSDFFSIEGTASVTVTGASGTLRYRERYL